MSKDELELHYNKALHLRRSLREHNAALRAHSAESERLQQAGQQLEQDWTSHLNFFEKLLHTEKADSDTATEAGNSVTPTGFPADANASTSPANITRIKVAIEEVIEASESLPPSAVQSQKPHKSGEASAVQANGQAPMCQACGCGSNCHAIMWFLQQCCKAAGCSLAPHRSDTGLLWSKRKRLLDNSSCTAWTQMCMSSTAECTCVLTLACDCRVSQAAANQALCNLCTLFGQSERPDQAGGHGVVAAAKHAGKPSAATQVLLSRSRFVAAAV